MMIYFDAVRRGGIEITPVEGATPFLVGAAFNAAGETYYDFRETITTVFTCVIHAESGRVRYACEDASAIAPGPGERVFGTDELPPDFFDHEFSYWQFDGEQFTPWIPTHAELAAAAELKKKRLLSETTAAIAPLQDAVDVKEATREEKKLLLELKTYRLALSRIDTSLAPGITWPPQPSQP